MTDPTVDEARTNQWSVTAWCSSCGYGREVDLLALHVAGRGNEHMSSVFKKLRCMGRPEKACGRPADALTVSRLVVGKTEDVARYGR